MFLATTALDQYWDKNQKILFLGEWCLKNKNGFEGLDYEILPYHWNNTEDMIEDMNYVYSTYNKLIPQLTKHLNNLHNLSFSQKYWSFLIGPWLFMFLNVLYDRFISLKKASKIGYNIETLIAKDTYAPIDFSHFYELIVDDNYNFCLYSDIIKNLDLAINYEEEYFFSNINLTGKQTSDSNKSSLYKSKWNSVRSLLSSTFSMNKRESLLRKMLDFYKYDEIVQIVTSGMSNKDKRKFFSVLNHKMNPSINWEKNQLKKDNPLNFSLRIPLRIESKDDQFTVLAKKILVRHLPKEYVENFIELRTISNSCEMAKSPSAIILRCPHEFNSVVRFYCAEKKENGTKVISMQHGGGYGIRPFKGIDEIEIDLSDIYLTCGWGPFKSKEKKFYLTKTAWIEDYKYNKNGDVILLGSGLRRYFTYGFSQPPTFNKHHIDFNTRFIENLPSKIRKKLIYRFHLNYGYNELSSIKKTFPDLRTSTRDEYPHYHKNLLYNSRLVIATTNYTTFLESFTINHPTLILWPNDFNKISTNLIACFDKLNEAGILYYSPEECAQKLNKDYDDIMLWWMSEDVQQARREFCSVICRYSSSFGKELAVLAKSQINYT